MDTDIFNALLKVNTSSQWSTLDSVLIKLNKFLKTKKIDARTLGKILFSIERDKLNKNGIWITSFGKDYMPIILTNRAYARARSVCGGSHDVCTCGVENHENSAVVSTNKKMNKYFKSMDYNAGRHATDNSIHKANCLCWTPPSSGHLHSWRRGWNDDGKK